VGDVVGFAVCLVMMRYGLKMTLDSAMLGSTTIKNLVFPEWWLLAPLPDSQSSLPTRMASVDTWSGTASGTRASGPAARASNRLRGF